ncbi:hypothetical protein AU503_07850 [Lonsdalea populi]|nr:hypothetical protein AU503_07850 [Lonsdalea populi]
MRQQPPQPRLHRAQQHIQQLHYRLQHALDKQIGQNKQRFGESCSHLQAVSPLATLGRGYSVTTTPSGEVLKKAGQIAAGDTLSTRLQDGWVESRVTAVHPADKA